MIRTSLVDVFAVYCAVTSMSPFRGSDPKYVTLDDPDVRLLAKTDPSLFLQRFSPPVIIDEIQYAPELLPYI